MRSVSRVVSVALCSWLLACGPTPPPQTGPEGPQGGGGPASPVAEAPLKPKRQVSKEAKEDFGDAVKAHQAAVKGGGVNKSNCASIAGGFASVYESHPKLAEAKFNEGAVWEECGEVAKAQQAYQTVLSSHPNFGAAANNLGQLYFARGDMGQAVSYFSKAAGAKNSEGYANLALIQRNQALQNENLQLIKEAVNNVHRALAVDSFNIEAYATLALVLYDHAKTESQAEMARLICVQATKLDEKYAPVYNILGLILLRQEKVTPALREFRKAVTYNPDFKEALMNIGAITLNFRDYKSAEEAFRKVLTLNADKKMKVDALVGLGVAMRGQRNFTEAMARYKEALAIDPANVEIAYNQGILIQDYMFNAGNPVQAIQDLTTAANHLQRYVSGSKDRAKRDDAERRLKNINELLPMLREQQKMMQQSQGGAQKS